jgi:hypothetical protein
MITFRRLKFENGLWAPSKRNLELATSSARHSEGDFRPMNLLSFWSSRGIRCLVAPLVGMTANTSSSALRFYSELRASLRKALAPIPSERLRAIFAPSPLFSLCALCLCGIPFFFFSVSAAAQTLDKPAQTIDEDITAFAFAPDGRIVYSVRRLFKNKKYDMQRDDIWIQDTGGRRRRIFQGEHFTVANSLTPEQSDHSTDDVDVNDKKGKKDKRDRDKDKPTTPPFTYIVERFNFSPNGRMVLVQLLTSTIMNESSHQQDEPMTLALDESGREIKLSGDNAVIHEAKDATWLQDNATFVYLNEAVKPNLLFSFRYANVKTGPAGMAFEGRTFVASEPIPHTNSAIAIERDRNLSGPPRLQRLDLLAQEDKELATLDGYETGLSVSPSGKRVAYFIDKEVLEIRDIQNPHRLARVRIGLGAVQWSADETYLMVKRSPERKSGELVWIPLPQLVNVPDTRTNEVSVVQPDPIPILHGLTFRDFALSPDGKMLAVVPPGKRNLLLFSLPSR